MHDLLPVVISGIASGSAYGLLALGVVIIYRSTDTVNFAIGDTGTFVSYLALVAIGLHLPIWLSLTIMPILAGLIGVLTERLLIRPLGHRRDAVFIALVVTIGFGLLIRAIMGVAWGYRIEQFPILIEGTTVFAGIAIANNKLLSTGLALVAMCGVGYFFGRTNLGTAMRASAEDPFAARLIGLDSGRIAMASWFLGCAIAAIATMFIAGETGLTPSLAIHPLFRAFAGVFLGGLSSMPGAVIGGVLIGVLDNMAGRYVSPNFRETVVFGTILIVLFARPAGFLGVARKVRV